MRERYNQEEAHRRILSLTNRELDAVKLIALGKSNQAIASELSISIITVRHHLSSAYAKLGVEDRFELAILAYANELASVPEPETFLSVEPKPIKKSGIGRFLARILVNPENGCWEWQGFVDVQGYGKISVDFYDPCYDTRAHRFSYLYFNGPIPIDLVVDHICYNRKCVNPFHLRLLTNEENTDLSRNRYHIAKTCKNGHPTTPDNIRRFKNGIKYCHPCRLNNQRQRYERNKARNANA